MIIEDLNMLSKLLTNDKQKHLLKSIRKQYKKEDKYNHKLDLFFMRALDGAEPDRLKNELGL